MPFVMCSNLQHADMGVLCNDINLQVLLAEKLASKINGALHTLQKVLYSLSAASQAIRHPFGLFTFSKRNICVH